MPTFNIELTALVVGVATLFVWVFFLGKKSVSKEDMEKALKEMETRTVSRIESKASQKETQANVVAIREDISGLNAEINKVEEHLRQDLHELHGDIRQVRDWLMEDKKG